MTTVQDAAREAQTKHFEEMGADEEMKRITTAIYDGVDSMSDEQKRIMVRDALSTAHQSIGAIVEHPDAAGGFAMLAGGLIAVAGYANESMREAAEETSLGDKKVTEVIDLFKSLVQRAATAEMSPEHREAVQRIGERVKARVGQTGEDFDTVLRDEYQKAVAAGEVPQQGQPQAPAQQATEDESYGLYL